MADEIEDMHHEILLDKVRAQLSMNHQSEKEDKLMKEYEHYYPKAYDQFNKKVVTFIKKQAKSLGVSLTLLD